MGVDSVVVGLVGLYDVVSQNWEQFLNPLEGVRGFQKSLLLDVFHAQQVGDGEGQDHRVGGEDDLDIELLALEEALDEEFEFFAGLQHELNGEGIVRDSDFENGFDVADEVGAGVVELADSEAALALNVDVESAVFEGVDFANADGGADHVGICDFSDFSPGTDEDDAERAIFSHAHANHFAVAVLKHVKLDGRVRE
jgi:hypothetical protein